MYVILICKIRKKNQFGSILASTFFHTVEATVRIRALYFLRQCLKG